MKSRPAWFAVWPVALAVALVGPPAGAANATGSDSFCRTITELAEQAHTNFTAKQIDLSVPAFDAQSCRMSLSMSGANAYHCAYEFPYRSAQADGKVAALNAALRTCLGTLPAHVKDKGVNHPDTYDQSRYALGQVIVSISIKDKIALDRTFVFVGIHGVRPD